jgi:hypothetical protein
MKKTLRHLLLINLFIITNVACFSYNAPADASVLSFFGLFRKFTTWSKRQKEGFKVGDVTVAVDVTVDDLTIPVGKVLYAIHPSTARMFDGRVTINYDSSVLTLEKYGWFGDWCGFNFAFPSHRFRFSGFLGIYKQRLILHLIKV